MVNTYIKFMGYDLKTDDEILLDLAKKVNYLRTQKGLRDADLASQGGIGVDLISKFRSGKGGISLKSFIKLLRGLGELHQLEEFLKASEAFSPMEEFKNAEKKPEVQRVRVPKSGSKIHWGDEE